MEGLEAETLSLIEKQRQRKAEVDDIVQRHRGAGLSGSTRRQLNDKVHRLEAILLQYKEDHEEILKKGKIDIPYIANQIGKSMITQIEDFINEIQSGNCMDYAASGGSRKGQAPFEKKIRLLGIKIEKLNFTIDEIYADFESETHWTKELFDAKHKFLQSMLQKILELEEEIELEDLDSENTRFDTEIAKDVLRNFNNVVRDMANRISAPKAASDMNQVESLFYDNRLPKLRIPVFKGEYLKWNGFKEIFESLVHSKKQMKNIDKMEYLKTHVEGEPSRIISPYLLSGQNYDDAWNALKKRYNNKRKLLTIHLDNMKKPMGKDVTSKTLKELYDNINEGMIAIKNMGIDTSSWGPVILHIVIENLDKDNRALFEEKFNEKPDDIPELKIFLQFLESRWKALEIMESIKPCSSIRLKNSSADESKVFHINESLSGVCPKCKQEHKLKMCPKFLAMLPNVRFRFVKNSKLCYRCLQKHNKGECDSNVKACDKCQSNRHNALIHLEKFQPAPVKATVAEIHNQEDEDIDIERTLAVISSHEIHREVLGTAIVLVKDLEGNCMPARVLIDTGAQKNYITESLAQKLHLPRESCRTTVTGIGKIQAFKVKHSMSITIETHFDSTFEKNVKALVMGRKLTSPIPDRKIEEKLPENWQQLQLADPTFNTPGDIDLVLGIGFFVNILLPGMKKPNNSNLMALNSKIGWIIFGECKGERSENYKDVQSMVSISEVQEDLTRFWELEEISTEKPLSAEDSYCEEFYQSTHRRDEDGRYIVKIPFKQNLQEVSNLGNSRKKALQRFYHLETKFRQNRELSEEYKKFIREYINLGHMKRVYDNQTDDDVYFMPHHAIIRPESTTTKLRVVFDGSAKSMQNGSVNERTIAGPRLQDDIMAILLRWRTHKYVITADIEKMYRQILVDPEHRKYQRIFWRDNPTDNMGVFELSTVTYGTTSAPYLAIKTLQQLAKDEGEGFPEAAKVVLEDFYVDDLLSGGDTISECRSLQENLRELLSRGGMSLRKWSSNENEVLKELKSEDISRSMVNFGDPEKSYMKMLGLHWNPIKDCFTFQNNNRPIKKVIVVGNIGCGKTTLLQLLKFEENTEVLLEPVDKWTNCDGVNLLRNFYQHPSQWGFKFQDYVITTLVENHTKTSNAEIKIMERSIFCSKNVFLKLLLHSGHLSAAEFKILDKRCDNLIKTLGITADIILYLRTDPIIAYERMKSRGRTEENDIPLAVIEELHEYHEEYADTVKIPVKVIDANKSSGEILSEVKDVLSNLMSKAKITKRDLCSDIAKIFDPLGLIAPLTVVGKMIFQKTWRENLDWNDKLPEEIHNQWIKFRRCLDEITKIKIPRWVHTLSSSCVELHGFCDASQKAYAAAIYVKVIIPDGSAKVNLIMAKSKVAPVKHELTVAKLELCGALLLSKLYKYVVKSMKWEKAKFTAWCDSQITLAWIKGDPSRWQIFVSNRIAQIQEITRKENWRYIPSNQNSADCCSRGITALELQNHSLWWNGPSWLAEEENAWPVFQYVKAVNMPNLKKKKEVSVLVTHNEDDGIEWLLGRFSCFKRMKIVVAYCLRFIQNCKMGKLRTGSLSTDELLNAELCIIKKVQEENYAEDIHNILNKKKLNNRNGILALSPMLDDSGLLRIKGRLQNSFLSYDEKHPIILPRSSVLSKLVVRNAHLKSKHSMETLTSYIVRRRYWIVQGKNLIKTTIFNCVVCKKQSRKTEAQQMGQLPSCRILLNHAFYNTGVDYAGPFELKAWKGKCNRKIKSYVAVFVCMATKAIHLELVTDLSAECFIAAYRRFASRRPPCKNLYSDCGTNFIGANNILKADLKAFQDVWKEELKTLLVEGLTWHFNPPSAPHMGGLWEAGVKSMKTCLLKHIGNSSLTYEEFNTILVEIEGCLNSRPLAVLRNVPEDRMIITPSHFLTGKSMFSNPEYVDAGSISLAQRWKYLQHLNNEICQEYKIQVLQELQPRKKWKHENPNLKVGTVVIVDQDNMFAHKWPMGVIQEVFPGPDGFVRVVSVKMDNGKIIKRPITKIGCLPVFDE